MHIKLKSLIKESRQDIAGLAIHYRKYMIELESLNVGSTRSAFRAQVHRFWKDRILRWHINVNRKGYELEPDVEKNFQDEILDWINKMKKEIEAIKKSQ